MYNKQTLKNKDTNPQRKSTNINKPQTQVQIKTKQSGCKINKKQTINHKLKLKSKNQNKLNQRINKN